MLSNTTCFLINNRWQNITRLILDKSYHLTKETETYHSCDTVVFCKWDFCCKKTHLHSDWPTKKKNISTVHIKSYGGWASDIRITTFLGGKHRIIHRVWRLGRTLMAPLCPGVEQNPASVKCYMMKSKGLDFAGESLLFSSWKNNVSSRFVPVLARFHHHFGCRNLNLTGCLALALHPAETHHPWTTSQCVQTTPEMR